MTYKPMIIEGIILYRKDNLPQVARKRQKSRVYQTRCCVIIAYIGMSLKELRIVDIYIIR